MLVPLWPVAPVMATLIGDDIFNLLAKIRNLFIFKRCRCYGMYIFCLYSLLLGSLGLCSASGVDQAMMCIVGPAPELGPDRAPGA